MISRMAKPEEVLVVENDQGEVVREFMKDTDSISLYKNMRETLGRLTSLDIVHFFTSVQRRALYFLIIDFIPSCVLFCCCNYYCYCCCYSFVKPFLFGVTMV